MLHGRNSLTPPFFLPSTCGFRTYNCFNQMMFSNIYFGHIKQLYAIITINYHNAIVDLSEALKGIFDSWEIGGTSGSSEIDFWSPLFCVWGPLFSPYIWGSSSSTWMEEILPPHVQMILLKHKDKRRSVIGHVHISIT